MGGAVAPSTPCIMKQPAAQATWGLLSTPVAIPDCNTGAPLASTPARSCCILAAAVSGAAGTAPFSSVVALLRSFRDAFSTASDMLLAGICFRHYGIRLGPHLAFRILQTAVLGAFWPVHQALAA
jgi:hypothetical protein